MRKVFLISIGFLVWSAAVYGQRKETFKAFEDSIIRIHHEILNEQNSAIRYQKNEKMIQLFDDVLKQRNSINYSFDSIRTIAILTSPDKKVRVITWYLIDDNGMHDHFGFIQSYNSDKGKYDVYQLTDCWPKIVNPSMQTLGTNTWFGALYTQLIQTKDDDKTYYTLLGWNGGNVFSQFKVIEILSINHDRPVFGANIFRNYTKRTMRVIFEYAPVGRLNLKYDKQSYVQKADNKNKNKKKKNKTNKAEIDTMHVNMIIFDRLIPMDEYLQKVPQCYVGEASLNDAFIEQNGKWYFKSDVLGRNPDKAMPLYDRKKQSLYRPSKKQP